MIYSNMNIAKLAIQIFFLYFIMKTSSAANTNFHITFTFNTNKTQKITLNTNVDCIKIRIKIKCDEYLRKGNIWKMIAAHGQIGN